MKFSKFLLTLAAAAAACFSAQAQISVGLGGSSLYDFSTTPPPAEWATTNNFNNTGGAGAYGTPAQVATAIQALNQGAVATNLPTTAANGTFAYARHNTAGGYLVTQPTTVAAGLLKATLRNTSGGQISHIDVSYNFGVAVTSTTETAPGHQAFFSTNGQANSWQPIAAFSGLNAATPVATTLFVGVWEPNTDIYLLWADDNTDTNPDGGYTIDDFQVSNVVPTNAITPLSVILTAPTDGQVFLATPDLATVTVSASTAGTTPSTSVSFYTNGILATTVAGAGPYSAQVSLAAGTHTVHATAANGVDPVATSATSTIRVRPEFQDYLSGLHVQSFDSMGPAGTETPTGWYVGAALPATSVAVTPGDGSAGAAGGVLGWNYGTSGDSDRALGTAPTGADRNMVLRLRNTSSSNIVSFQIFYDGEVWRNYTNATDGWLTNFISYDFGATWTPTAFNFDQPTARVQPMGAVVGNDPANRVASIGGPITPPTPISPAGVVYIRWHDFNGANVTDGGLAIDNFSFEATDWSQYVLNVAITSPADGANVEADCAGMASITVSATASGLTTNVAFQVDGGAALNDTTAPFSATLPPVGLGLHTITATAKDSFGNTAVDTINVTVIANQGPAITFTNTYSGANTGLTFLVGSPVTAQFTATDGNLTLMEFLVNGAVILSTNVAFNTLTVGDVLAGTSTLTVRATDACGNVSLANRVLTVTNPSVVVVVSNGSNWRYFNSNTAPPNDGEGDQWFETDYDDSGWLSGFAELGGGDAVLPPVAATVPERTLLDIGPAGNRHLAAYFRHTFTTASPVSALSVRSMQDDGAVVYLNGTIVATFNMPIQGSYVYGDLASGAVAGDGSTYFVSNITASTVAGLNTLAVEVHQSDAGSSDISFDLMLWSTGGPALTIVINGSNYEVSWSDPGGTYILQESSDVGSPLNWADVPVQTNPLIRPLTTPSPKFYRLRSP